MKEIQWLYNLKDGIFRFMEHQKSPILPGYYRYSWSGDLYGENGKWNVGSSVFALKIFYLLGCEKNKEIEEAARYILSFLDSRGQIYDPLVFKKSFFRNFMSSLWHGNWQNLWNVRYKIAETRQALSALKLYHLCPLQSIDSQIPLTLKAVDNYLSGLDWRYPWAAGSHFSHLMFFYNLYFHQGLLSADQFKSLTDFSIGSIYKYQNEKTGGWHQGDLDERNIINGAMKVITGLIAIGRENDLEYPKRLLDTCLNAVNDVHACDNFNVILVLNYASKLLNRNYRQGEIVDFVIRRLEVYRSHYREEQGGFSFFPQKANDVYYGTRITKGLLEADIHGTVLFLWGISMMIQILGIQNELKFFEFQT